MIPHWVTDLSATLIPIGTIVMAVVGLMIRNAILTSTASLSERIGAIGSKITAHEAADVEKHKAIDYAIEQHDRRFDRIEGTGA